MPPISYDEMIKLWDEERSDKSKNRHLESSHKFITLPEYKGIKARWCTSCNSLFIGANKLTEISARDYVSYRKSKPKKENVDASCSIE